MDFNIKPGVDVEEVARIKNLLAKWGDKFLHRVFTDRELEYSLGKATTPCHLAGRFAAKEAVIKTLKTHKAPPLKSIEIMRDKNGAPSVKLHGEAAEHAKHAGIFDFEVSISHTHNYTVAFVLAFTRKDASEEPSF